MIEDAIPDEFLQEVVEYTEASVNPVTKKPGVAFGERKSLHLIVKASDLDAGFIKLKQMTPAFHDDDSANLLAKFLSKPELGIEVSAENLLDDRGEKRAVQQNWTIDLSKASNFAEVQANRR